MHALAFDDTPSMNALRPNLPPDLERIVSRCLKKRPEDRYPDARALIEDLRVLRRETESGLIRPLSLKDRIGDTFDRLAHLKPFEYAWLAGGILAVAGAVYLLFSNVGMGSLIPLAIIGLLIYRRIRNQPRRLLDLFVRKVARIPEVRFLVCVDRKVTVGVDRAVGQLYGRINNQLNYCNRKLFFGQPFSVQIRHDLSADEIRQLLEGPGVQYVRDDVALHDKPTARPPPMPSAPDVEPD